MSGRKLTIEIDEVDGRAPRIRVFADGALVGGLASLKLEVTPADITPRVQVSTAYPTPMFKALCKFKSVEQV